MYIFFTLDAFANKSGGYFNRTYLNTNVSSNLAASLWQAELRLGINETITGNLRGAYQECVPGTMLCVDQLNIKRRTNPELRNNGFYTADGSIYFMDEKIIIIYAKAHDEEIRVGNE